MPQDLETGADVLKQLREEQKKSGAEGGPPPSGGGGRGGTQTGAQAIDELRKTQPQWQAEQRKQESVPGQLGRDIVQGGKEFGQGFAAGAPSTFYHTADWVRGTLGKVIPGYQRQLEESDKEYALQQKATPKQMEQWRKATPAARAAWRKEYAKLPEEKKKFWPAEMPPGVEMMPGTDWVKNPDVKKLITPPNTFMGKFGFGVEQAGEEFALGAVMPEIEGAGLVRRGLRIGSAAAQGGLLGGMQTGTWEGAGTGAALGAVGGVVGEAARTGAEKSAEKELFGKKAAKTPEEAELRKEAAGRFVGESGTRKATVSSIDQEIAANEAKLKKLMETDPVYSARTIEIDDVLAPVKKRIQELQKEGTPLAQKQAKALEKKLGEWREQLGYKEAAAATEVEDKTHFGTPFKKTVPGTAAQTTTTAAQVNQWAKTLARGEAAGKEAAKGAATKLIPEEEEVIRHAIETTERDSLLKRAMTHVVSGPQAKSRLNAMLLLGGGVGAEVAKDLLEAAATEKGSRHAGMERSASGWLTKGQVAAAIGAITLLANRNPKYMTSVLLFLRKYGEQIPLMGETLARQGVREATKGEDEGPAPSTATQWEMPNPEAAPAPAATPAPVSAAPAQPSGGANEWEMPNPAVKSKGGANREAPSGGRGRASITPEMKQTFQAAGRANGVVPSLLMGMMKVESGGNPNAVSRTGARGLMQFMPATARQFGIDPTDWKQSIEGAARYMGQMLRKYDGDVRLALAAYNAGPGAVDRHRGVPPYKETQAYVNKVLAAARGVQA